MSENLQSFGVKTRIISAATGAILLLTGSSCDVTVGASPDSGRSGTAAAGTSDAGAPEIQLSAQDVKARLGELAVKGRAPKTGYDRDQFGEAWSQEVNGCDTRNGMLQRDLIDEKLDDDGCTVLSGTLLSAYSGEKVGFVRGEKTSGDVQVDHVVSLSNAWQTGAQQLDAARREVFANDPSNLEAIEGPLNQQKGDADAATWLPPDRGSRCWYVARQILTKDEYGLWVTPAEHEAMTRVLDECPEATLSVPS